METAVARNEYLCAGRFTIADICVAYTLLLARNIGIVRGPIVSREVAIVDA